MRFAIIDAHAHCGLPEVDPGQDITDYCAAVKGSNITGVVMFPPVMGIYDRYDPGFRDSPEWQRRRQQANRYLLTLADRGLEVFPFFFIWNDFAVDQIGDSHRGIKWHRHGGEPPYHYHDPKCKAALDEIRQRNLPITFEEEWHHTLHFINELAPDLKVIIPHCGILNGGFEKFCRAGIWERSTIFTDTALAPPAVIAEYVRTYGHQRIMFGSDFPFGDPVDEYRKILELGLSGVEQEALLQGNIQELLAGVTRPAKKAPVARE